MDNACALTAGQLWIYGFSSGAVLIFFAVFFTFWQACCEEFRLLVPVLGMKEVVASLS
jgi:hypothetical protein